MYNKICTFTQFIHIFIISSKYNWLFRIKNNLISKLFDSIIINVLKNVNFNIQIFSVSIFHAIIYCHVSISLITDGKV